MVDLKAFLGAEILNDMFEVLNRLQEKAISGQFIYRGESCIYPQVSSSLYRQCVKEGIVPKGMANTTKGKGLLLSELQDDIVEQAQSFLPDQRNSSQARVRGGSDPMRNPNSAEYKTLGLIQHYGGPTNLIGLHY